jgi:hypothetical protein
MLELFVKKFVKCLRLGTELLDLIVFVGSLLSWLINAWKTWNTNANPSERIG